VENASPLVVPGRAALSPVSGTLGPTLVQAIKSEKAQQVAAALQMSGNRRGVILPS
jgi:hypothetical protein